MKNQNTAFLVVDLGNTDLKFGLFAGDSETYGRGWESLETLFVSKVVDHILLSNVASSEFSKEIKKVLPNALLFQNLQKFPIQNLYKTPETLGQDRLANAVAINKLRNGKPALSIDVGTCLKFDFVDDTGAYLGGSISPGLRMRFRALHDFTANLPLIVSWDQPELIGTDTTSSLVSGVLEGITNEINATIQRYQERYQNLTIFLTGGDHVYFENAIKCRIFADPNLTLQGLKIILEANV